MTTATINSNDINSVSFPGSEQGVTLVQLVGAVVVVCSISVINLRVTAAATTTASSESSVATPYTRAQIGAVTEVSATASCGSVVRLAFSVDSQTASATCSAGVFSKRRLSAVGSGVATPQGAGSYLRVARSALVSGQAVSDVSARQNVYLAAASAPSAVVGEITSGRRFSASAVTDGVVTSIAFTSARFKLSALSSSVAAAADADPNLRISFGATESAAAFAPAVQTSSRIAATPSAQQCLALAASAAACIKFFPGASAVAFATGSASQVLFRQVGASVVATVSVAVAAADYSSTIPAPVERRMTLISTSRRMEVTA